MYETYLMGFLLGGLGLDAGWTWVGVGGGWGVWAETKIRLFSEYGQIAHQIKRINQI